MFTFLSIGAAVASSCGLVVTVHNRQWGNTAAAAYASATVLMACAVLAGRSDLAHVRINGPGTKGCAIMNVRGSTVTLSCPVPVSVGSP